MLPVIDATGNAGPSITDQPEGFAPDVNDEWRFQRELSLTVRQILFDGGDRSNDILRSAALTDSLSFRMVEQAENIALDAVEAYIDVRRLTAILALARQNRARLESITGLVKDRTVGGSAPQSDLQQAHERVAGALATEKQIEQALDEARARYRQVIGSEPANLERVKFPAGVPRSREAANAIALKDNPSIRALELEAQAAEYAVSQAESGYLPTVNLEGVASIGEEVGGTPGKMNSLTAQVTMQWNLYQGRGTDYRTRALKERVSKAVLDRQVRLRQVQEIVDRAYAAYDVGAQRVTAARAQSQETQKVLKSYQEEYKAGKRSLLDLLDAQNATFTSQFQLTSAEAVNIFAAYQLLGAMNHLLSTFDLANFAEAQPSLLDQGKRNLFSIEIEPLR